MHKAFLIKTIDLARERRGFCAPNPAVGALIVKEGRVIGEGRHWAAGEAHAEIIALRKAGSDAEKATLYVSLEPCSHHGRTPPCVDAIIQAKIARVFFGYSDPNPQVCGSGQRALQQAGIDCQHIVSDEAQQFYRSYHYWTQHQKPWVSVKLALSLDGKIALPRQGISLTGSAANTLTHQLRRQSDAILTTIKTVISDDPQLNAREGQTTWAKPIYVLDRELKLPAQARVLTTAQSLTLLHDRRASVANKPWQQQDNMHYIPIRSEDGKLSLKEAIASIGAVGIHDLWVEAGSECSNALLQQGLVNELYLYITPNLLGNPGIPAFPDPITLQTWFPKASWQILGDDVLYHLSTSQH